MLSRLFINFFNKLKNFVLLLICIFTYLYRFIIAINIKYNNKLWGIIKQKYSYLFIYINYFKYIIIIKKYIILYTSFNVISPIIITFITNPIDFNSLIGCAIIYMMSRLTEYEFILFLCYNCLYYGITYPILEQFLTNYYLKNGIAALTALAMVVGIKYIIENDKIKIINKEDIYFFNR